MGEIGGGQEGPQGSQGAPQRLDPFHSLIHHPPSPTNHPLSAFSLTRPPPPPTNHPFARQMTSYAYNVLTTNFPSGAGPNEALLNFIDENDYFVREMAATHAATDDYWLAVAQVMAQADGVRSGFNNFSACSSGGAFAPLSARDMLLINLDGDLYDLMAAFPDANQSAATAPRALRRQASVLRCSALFKQTDTDVFFGHDTVRTDMTAAPLP